MFSGLKQSGSPFKWGEILIFFGIVLSFTLFGEVQGLIFSFLLTTAVLRPPPSPNTAMLT